VVMPVEKLIDSAELLVTKELRETWEHIMEHKKMSNGGCDG